eukprot:6197488-Pleurochrysis_carterae.AAC.1
MPLFDSLGWAQGFERMLLLQWEVYANGLSPMPIVVARSSWIYGTQSVRSNQPRLGHGLARDREASENQYDDSSKLKTAGAVQSERTLIPKA